MLVWIWTRNDGTGILDDEFRDGDIFMVKEDSFEPSIGEMSKKAYLIAKMPDPPNKAAVMEGLVQEEWEPDSSGGTRIKRQRKYKINWREKFDAEEAEIVRDPLQTLGIVADRFTVADCIRKN